MSYSVTFIFEAPDSRVAEQIAGELIEGTAAWCAVGVECSRVELHQVHASGVHVLLQAWETLTDD